MRKDPWRMHYHLMPPDGWLNDPNGLCQYKGQYHVFFQYSPNTPAPDGRTARTWGHYAGKDLLSLEFKGVPFWPETLDRDGCYSGSALTTDEGIWLFYTGNIKNKGDFDYIHDGREANEIRVLTDGERFGKKELLLGTRDYPAHCTRHVRDPKVWKEGDCYYMVLGARIMDDPAEPKEEKGAILFYRSEDLKKWTLLKELTTEKPFGYMWECPDYIEMNGISILSFCPQGLPAEEYRNQNNHQSGYARITGPLEGEQSLGDFHEWDYGFDFYAPQSFEDESGRRLLIGWVGLPDEPYKNPTKERGWENCLTVPRELSLDDGGICQVPIRELFDLRGSGTSFHGGGTYLFPDGVGDTEIGFNNPAEDWKIVFGEKEAVLSYTDGILELSLSEEAGRGRKVRKLKVPEIHSLRILLDASILEIYIDDYHYAMTSRFYPEYTEQTQWLKVHYECPGAEIMVWNMNIMDTNYPYLL